MVNIECGQLNKYKSHIISLYIYIYIYSSRLKVNVRELMLENGHIAHMFFFKEHQFDRYTNLYHKGH